MSSDKIENKGLADGISITDENVVVHLKYLIRQVDKIDKKLEDDYVTNTEFEPIKRIVYGVVMLIVAGFIAAFLRGVN